MKIYPVKSFNLNFRNPFKSKGCLNFRLGTFFLKDCILVIPSCEELNVIKSLNRTVFVMMYTKYRVLERNLCVK